MFYLLDNGINSCSFQNDVINCIRFVFDETAVVIFLKCRRKFLNAAADTRSQHKEHFLFGR